MNLPIGMKSWITTEHMALERNMNVAVSAFYRRPGQDAFELWEVIHTEKFTSDMNGAIRSSVVALLKRVIDLNYRKSFDYFDEDRRVEVSEPFDGELEIRTGDDYQKMSVKDWTEIVGTWVKDASAN